MPDRLARLLRSQEGVVTVSQAYACGLTERQVRTLVAHGWSRPLKGVLVSPGADPFRASVRAGLLMYPLAVACGLTAARLFGLWGLPRWTPAELPELLLPAGQHFTQRRGVRLRSGRQGVRTIRSGFPTTSLVVTVAAIARRLRTDDLICLLDSALRLGWWPSDADFTRRDRLLINGALALTDPRSESAFETLLRLLLVRAGIGPEALQYEVYDAGGRLCARLDMAWPSVRLAVEADGRAFHDLPTALYRDRVRANDLEIERWSILRFTWSDLVGKPDWVVEQVRRALASSGQPKAPRNRR